MDSLSLDSDSDSSSESNIANSIDNNLFSLDYFIGPMLRYSSKQTSGNAGEDEIAAGWDLSGGSAFVHSVGDFVTASCGGNTLIGRRRTTTTTAV